MTTDQLIEQIASASRSGDWSAVQAHLANLHTVMRDDGRPISQVGAFRLVEALSKSTARDAHAGGPDPYVLISQIKAAAEHRPLDKLKLKRSWEILYGLLSDPTVPIENQSILEVLNALKSARIFDLLARTSERALIRNVDDTAIRILYGQALIDSGQMHAGIEMLGTIGKMSNVPRGVQIEAAGLLGRAHKQIYIDHVKMAPDIVSVRERFRPHLEKSIAAYSTMYDVDLPGENFWLGINIIALLVRAREDGHRNIANPTGSSPEELARRLIAVLEPRSETDDDPWLNATVGEAYLALSDYQNATEFFGRYIRHKLIDTFAIGGTIRQLEEIWNFSPVHGSGGAILAALKEELMTQPESAYRLPARALGEISRLTKSPAYKSTHETVFKGVGFQKLAEIQTIVERAASVAAIKHRAFGTVGTGFLIRGNDLHPSLGNDYYILTNAHVVADPNPDASWYEPDRMAPTDVNVVLEGAAGERLSFDPTVYWQSPSNLHDATLLKLDRPPVGAKPLPIAAHDHPLIPSDDNTEGTTVSVIGYPLGGPLSLSQALDLNGANGRLVDYGPRRAKEDDPIYMHYRAATEPGNSGSPVFETRHWGVIGLHHSGFNEYDGGLDRLGGKSGRQIANEGICIRSIRAAIGRHNRKDPKPWLRRRR